MRCLWFALLLTLGTRVALAQELLRAPLPALPDGQEIRIDEVNMPPGFSAPAHRHNAHVYVVVIEGAVEMQVAGKPVQRLSAGQVFTENPSDVHTVMRNPSESEPARFVSFVIKAASASAFVPVPQNDER